MSSPHLSMVNFELSEPPMIIKFGGQICFESTMIERVIERRIQLQFDRLEFNVGHVTSVVLANHYILVKVRDIRSRHNDDLSDVGISDAISKTYD
jgi:hypothetical protein